jgi:hypothetical protein
MKDIADSIEVIGFVGPGKLHIWIAAAEGPVRFLVCFSDSGFRNHEKWGTKFADQSLDGNTIDVAERFQAVRHAVFAWQTGIDTLYNRSFKS